MIKAAVIGHPIGHSKSPLIHNYWIKKYGLEGSYEAIDIAPENLGDGLKRLIDEGYSGFNLTVPHKELVLQFCDFMDEDVCVFGAANTLTVRDGLVKGFNTDGFGFIQNIKTAHPDFDFGAGKAVVLGGGGAARAIIYALMDAGAPEVVVLNRTKDKAQKLVDELGASAAGDWEHRAEELDAANLLVNTTSLGMAGQVPLEIDLSALPKEALVNDIVYAPLYTPLLEDAQARGNKVVTGIGMLLHQARGGFEKWFGVMPEVDQALEDLVLR